MTRVQFKWDRCVSLILQNVYMFAYLTLSTLNILISAHLNIFKSVIGVKSNEPYNLK